MAGGVGGVTGATGGAVGVIGGAGGRYRYCGGDGLCRHPIEMSRLRYAMKNTNKARTAQSQDAPLLGGLCRGVLYGGIACSITNPPLMNYNPL